MRIERSRRLGTDAHVPMLAIVGDSAAGKTTLTKGLVRALGQERITSVCVDDYHRYDREERRHLGVTPLHPDANYVAVMEQHLQLLSRGEPILKPVYDHSNGTLGRPVLVEPAEFVIVEGLLALSTKVARACFDLTVYLDPPEPVRTMWKVRRDVAERGYDEAQVRREIAARREDAEIHIRPQRSVADVVVRFSPIPERGESLDAPLSCTMLLRGTVDHPDLHEVITDDTRQAVHLKLERDEDGRPVEALHIHAYAPRHLTAVVEERIWSRLEGTMPLPDCLGALSDGGRSEPLALAQLILLYHLVRARTG